MFTVRIPFIHFPPVLCDLVAVIARRYHVIPVAIELVDTEVAIVHEWAVFDPFGRVVLYRSFYIDPVDQQTILAACPDHLRCTRAA